jgi:hypothetical protein
MSYLRNSLSLLLLAAGCFCAGAQERDTVAHEKLDNSVITEHMDKPMILSRQGISGEVNMGKIASVPSIMGNSDPIRFVRLLPSVQLSTEMEGGLYMQGSESSMTLVSQQGVPVYGITHLLGLFSVFNTPHYKGIQYATTAGQESRLAGLVDIQLKDTVTRRFTGDVSLGLLSVQGTLGIPLGQKSSLTVSARRTFINTIYGGMLKYEDIPLRYGFTDANITWLWKPTKRDRIWVDLFGTLDQGGLSSGIIESVEASWYNGLGALHWNHYFSDATLKQKVYFTTAGIDPKVLAFNALGEMPSYIRDAGYRGTLNWKDWQFGAHYSYYQIQPQNPRSEGHFSQNANLGGEPVQNAMEAILSAEYRRNLGYWFQVHAGVGLHWYMSSEKRHYFGITPQVGLITDFQKGGKMELRYELKRQNLFQLGLTNMGLPVEFWLAAGDIQGPQWSHNFSLSYNFTTPDGVYALSSELYYRQLHNQLEYVGNFSDIYTGNYSLAKSVAPGSGRTFGANIMFQKQKGRLTGWISYAFSRSLRTFDDSRNVGEHPSVHDRPHELDIVVTYDFGRFDVGGTYVLASGAPYTPPKSIYLMGSRLICEYGDYNSGRLPYYSRMDISANWYFRKGPKGKSGINFSVYNVLGKVNELGFGMHVSYSRTSYSFKTSGVQLRFLPAIAIFHTF